MQLLILFVKIKPKIKCLFNKFCFTFVVKMIDVFAQLRYLAHIYLFSHFNSNVKVYSAYEMVSKRRCSNSIVLYNVHLICYLKCVRDRFVGRKSTKAMN